MQSLNAIFYFTECLNTINQETYLHIMNGMETLLKENQQGKYIISTN
jgi:hypothetical protein